MTDEQQAVFNALHSLRTIHGNFSDAVVPDETIRKIISAAVRAANSSARQCYSIIRLSGRERVKEICIHSAPQALVFLSDQTRLADEARRRGLETRPLSLYHLLSTTIDASLAAQNAVIAAKALGVDSMITNTLLRSDPDKLVKLLDIPEEGCMPLLAVLLGYPDAEPDHLQGRYLGPGLLHEGGYQRMSDTELEDMSAQYDDPDRHMGLSFAGWREKGHASYFDWFFKVWTAPRPAKDGQPPRDAAMILAKRGGFIKE